MKSVLHTIGSALVPLKALVVVALFVAAPNPAVLTAQKVQPLASAS